MQTELIFFFISWLCNFLNYFPPLLQWSLSHSQGTDGQKTFHLECVDWKSCPNGNGLIISDGNFIYLFLIFVRPFKSNERIPILLSIYRNVIKQGNYKGLVKQGCFILPVGFVSGFSSFRFGRSDLKYRHRCSSHRTMGYWCERDCSLGIKELCYAFLFFLLQLPFLK